MIIRKDVLDIASAYTNRGVEDGFDRTIVDCYNRMVNPLPRGCRLRYDNDVSIAFVSVVFMIAGAQSIFPVECSLFAMIDLAVNMGILRVPSADFVPKKGDVVIFNDRHLGILIDSTDDVGTVLEYTDGKVVATQITRETELSGFIAPRYHEVSEEGPIPKKQDLALVTATAEPEQNDEQYKGLFITVETAPMRNTANARSKKLADIPAAILVNCDGSFDGKDGNVYLYVTTIIDDVAYTGYILSDFLQPAE